MNGRTYDPEIGRFLSADPFVQFPESTQGFNRYSYVGNNPLSYTDPSGFFLKKLLGKVLSTFAPLLNFIPGCQIWCASIASAVGGYLLSRRGSLRFRCASLTSSPSGSPAALPKEQSQMLNAPACVFISWINVSKKS
jgi:hypothetical protein